MHKSQILTYSMHGTNNHILFLLAFFLSYACASTKVYYESDERYKPTRSVEILQYTPKQAYIVIATLEASSPTYENGNFVFEKMRNKAQRIGAHAIIPVEFYSIPDYSSAPFKPAYIPPRKPGKVNIPIGIIRKQPKSWGKALAIRYLQIEK